MFCIEVQTLRLDNPVYAQNVTGNRRPTALETTHVTVPAVGIDGENQVKQQFRSFTRVACATGQSKLRPRTTLQPR